MHDEACALTLAALAVVSFGEDSRVLTDLRSAPAELTRLK